MILKSINPWNGSLIEEFEEYSDDKIEKIIAGSGEAFAEWEKSGFALRRSLLKRGRTVAQQYKKVCRINNTGNGETSA